MSEVLLLACAVDFACRHHAGQRRKGLPGQPYVNHVADVARRVARATGGNDAALVAAALLHDTVEDGEATNEDVERAFGPEVAAMVAEVTDDPSLDENARKERQVETAPFASDRAKIIKIADKASNLNSLAVGARRDARVYADWAERVAAGLRGVNGELEAGFDAALAALRSVTEE